mmetsp:Transcript_27386/g.59812  ORF Transcript_27386/g.59812 Transcript_27386/m.59812 type:complete len:226 (+) Transcript_27386:691-1368(+)
MEGLANKERPAKFPQQIQHGKGRQDVIVVQACETHYHLAHRALFKGSPARIPGEEIYLIHLIYSSHEEYRVEVQRRPVLALCQETAQKTRPHHNQPEQDTSGHYWFPDRVDSIQGSLLIDEIVRVLHLHKLDRLARLPGGEYCEGLLCILLAAISCMLHNQGFDVVACVRKDLQSEEIEQRTVSEGATGCCNEQLILMLLLLILEYVVVLRISHEAPVGGAGLRH